MYAGIKLIADERMRQIEKKGFTKMHDMAHSTTELACAATSYLMEMLNRENKEWGEKMPPLPWPWDWDDFKPKELKQDLVRAGALIAAALDRLEPSDEQP
jgi:hypothetical protein